MPNLAATVAIEVHVQREIAELLCTRSQLIYLVDDTDRDPSVIITDGAPGMERMVAEMSVGEFFRNREDALIQATEYARRLTACWNACRGIPTDVLLSGREIVSCINPPEGEIATYKVVRGVSDSIQDIRELESRSGGGVLVEARHANQK